MTMIKEILGRLECKTVVITGGKRVGHYVALAYAELGANIVLFYRNSKKEAKETAAAVVEQFGVKVIIVQADVSKRDDVVRAAEEVIRNFEKVDVLINMASVFSPVKFEDMREEHLRDDLDAHFFGSIWTSQVFSPHMPVGSSIINISDRTAIGHTYKDLFDYTTTKGSVPAVTRSLAVEVAEKGIRVNDLAPGPIKKPEQMAAEDWAENLDRSPVKIPIDDDEAMKQFAFACVFTSLASLTNSSSISLDRGLNIVPERDEKEF